MNTLTDKAASNDLPSVTASEYRVAHRNRLMALTKLKSAIANSDELGRIRSVETVESSLWITLSLLDGSTRGFRPDKLRLATEAEEQSLKI